MKKFQLVLFLVLAAACIAAPLSIVLKYEKTLAAGTQFKFRTAPVDPYDPFRGRYVALRFQNDKMTLKESDVKDDDTCRDDQAWFVRIDVDKEGFAIPVEASRQPLAGENVIKVKARVRREWNAKKEKPKDRYTLDITYPFTRYYLPEHIAPAAEKLYDESLRRAGNNDENLARPTMTWATVRIKDNRAVIEELYINGKPAIEAVREEIEKQKAGGEK